MKSTIIHITITGVITFLSVISAFSQSTSSAVMEIRVEVISGASIERSDSTQTFVLSKNEIAYGEFSMMIPEGTEVLTSSREKVEMTNETGTWEMNSRMSVNESANGNFSFRFTTEGNNNILNGIHKGIQIATIEYL